MHTRFELHEFGDVIDGEMVYSPSGEALKEFLENIYMYSAELVIPSFVVMPNHFHAMIMVRTTGHVIDIEKECDRLISDFIGSFRTMTLRSQNAEHPLRWIMQVSRLFRLYPSQIDSVCDMHMKEIAEWHNDRLNSRLWKS